MLSEDSPLVWEGDSSIIVFVWAICSDSDVSSDLHLQVLIEQMLYVKPGFKLEEL